jgi:hypothetical protein
MQIKRDFAGSTDMWPTSAGGQLIEVANLTGFTVLENMFDINPICLSCSAREMANLMSGHVAAIKYMRQTSIARYGTWLQTESSVPPLLLCWVCFGHLESLQNLNMLSHEDSILMLFC